MKEKIGAICIIGLLAVLLVGLTMAHTEDSPYETKLLAGRYIEAGNVTVWNDENNISVTVSLADDWQLNETHIDVQNDVLDFPTAKKGNPKVGHFNYKNETHFLYGTATYTETIPLGNWTDGETLYIAVHTEISTMLYDEDGNFIDWNEESAWGAFEIDPYNIPNGAYFGRNWAMYFEYIAQ